MFSMTATFFLVELVVGYFTNSMALVADSFHMLSDVLALIIAYFSVEMSKVSSIYLFINLLKYDQNQDYINVFNIRNYIIIFLIFTEIRT